MINPQDLAVLHSRDWKCFPSLQHLIEDEIGRMAHWVTPRLHPYYKMKRPSLRKNDADWGVIPEFDSRRAFFFVFGFFFPQFFERGFHAAYYPPPGYMLHRHDFMMQSSKYLLLSCFIMPPSFSIPLGLLYGNDGALGVPTLGSGYCCAEMISVEKSIIKSTVAESNLTDRSAPSRLWSHSQQCSDQLIALDELNEAEYEIEWRSFSCRGFERGWWGKLLLSGALAPLVAWSRHCVEHDRSYQRSSGGNVALASAWRLSIPLPTLEAFWGDHRSSRDCKYRT